MHMCVECIALNRHRDHSFKWMPIMRTVLSTVQIQHRMKKKPRKLLGAIHFIPTITMAKPITVATAHMLKQKLIFASRGWGFRHQWGVFLLTFFSSDADSANECGRLFSDVWLSSESTKFSNSYSFLADPFHEWCARLALYKLRFK